MVKHTQHRYFSSVRAPVLVAGVIALSLLIVVRLDRYPEWDEAVYLSQSGGLNGVDSTPSQLVASREIGAAVLLRVLRLLSPSLANTRLMWLVVSFSFFFVGARLLSRHLRVPAGAIAAVFGTYWLTPVFAGSFFAFFPATVFMILAGAAYLSLREDHSGQLVWGVVLGVCLAAGMWLRQIEGALVIVGMLGHAFVITPRSFWARRRRGVALAIVTFTGSFIVPWIVDSTLRFGSVAERITLGRAQSFERGLSNQLPNYLATLRGRSQIYGGIANPPEWAIVVVTTALCVGVLVVIVSAALRTWRSSDRVVTNDGVDVGSLTLVWILGIGLIAFFAFFIAEVSDRYMVMGTAFLSAALVTTAWRLGRFLASDRAQRMQGLPWPAVGAIAAGFILWCGANFVIANAYETARFASGQVTRGHVETIRALAEGRPCAGVSRYGAPQIQFGTGCSVRIASDPIDAAAIVTSQQDTAAFTFVLWPERAESDLMLSDDYRSLVREGIETQQRMVVLFRSAAENES